MPFRILDLPLELRNMIYREIMLSQIERPTLAAMYDKYSWKDDDYKFATESRGYEKRKSRHDDAINFILTSAKIKAESSAILSEERVLRILVPDMDEFRRNIVNVAVDELSLGIPSLELLQTTRNLEMIISREWLLRIVEDTNVRNEALTSSSPPEAVDEIETEWGNLWLRSTRDWRKVPLGIRVKLKSVRSYLRDGPSELAKFHIKDGAPEQQSTREHMIRRHKCRQTLQDVRHWLDEHTWDQEIMSLEAATTEPRSWDEDLMSL
ncbi:MAG: hypothetical protein Q9169_008123, partial [Polycauliona sp. 2 TL-2023]